MEFNKNFPKHSWNINRNMKINNFFTVENEIFYGRKKNKKKNVEKSKSATLNRSK